MAYVKAEHPAKWHEYGSQAHKAIKLLRPSGEPVDLSEEELAGNLFSYRRWQKRLWDWRDFAQPWVPSEHSLKKVEALRNEILEDAIRSGRMEGYTSSSGQQRITPGPGLITLEALKKAVDEDSDEIMLRDGNKLFCSRLVMVAAAAPRKLKLAKREQISAAIEAVNDAADKAGEKIPNKSNLPPKVRKWLRDRGLRAKDTAQIRNIADDTQHAARRLPSGPTLASKRRRQG
jgi:hypothetical protein